MDPRGPDLLSAMQDRAALVARRWTPGEIAWSMLTSRVDDTDVLLLEAGWAWSLDDRVAVQTTDADDLDAVLDWSAGRPLELDDRDGGLLERVRRAGHRETEGVAFALEVRCDVDGAAPLLMPTGYVVRAADARDDLVGIHRASWLPAALPFAPGFEPAVPAGSSSSFTAAMLASIQGASPYRSDLHLVVEAPDGSLAASCIVWLDERSGVGALEPLGVHPSHRRRGLAIALSVHAVQAVGRLGGDAVVVHPRGDWAYPAPRAAYLAAGYRPTSRTRVFAPARSAC